MSTCPKHGQYIANGGRCPVCEGLAHRARGRPKADPKLIERALRQRPPSGAFDPDLNDERE